MNRPTIDCSALAVLADLTHKLTVLRLQNCGHLCIENFAPELFGKLLQAYAQSETAPEGAVSGAGVAALEGAQRP